MSQFIIYIRFYLISTLTICIPLVLNYAFLKNSGEFSNYDKIFTLQNKNTHEEIIYGSALFDNIQGLKLHIINKKKPKIIAFGSSRVYQFRESYFSKSFYNLGYTVPSINDGLSMATKMISTYHPEIVLLGVDFWWFNENLRNPNYDLIVFKKSNEIDPAHLLLPFKWLKNKTISFSEYAQLFHIYQKKHIGVIGKLKQTGIASDGSYYHTRTMIGENPEFVDVDFKGAKLFIKNGTNNFVYGSLASEIHFHKFLELLQLFQKHNIKVILFFPPLAPEINKEMKKFNYSYINDLKKKIKKHGIKIYDFTDPTQSVATSDCEFIDGYHGGDILYAKILKYMIEKEPVLKPYVKQRYLEEIIAKYSGLAMIPNKKITLKNEVDFLGIGCKKCITSSP